MGRKKSPIVRGSWKHIPLDENLAAKGAKEGLLGIEELTDYTLLGKSNRGKPKRVPVINAPGFRGNKDLSKFAEDDEEGENNDNDITQEEAPKTKKKTKKKKKSKKKAPVEPESVDGSDNDELIFESDIEEETSLSYHMELPEWSSLHVPEPILKAIHELGFKTPTPIQRLTLPAAISGHMDIVGAAETGSGKTFAFGIPILTRIMESKSCGEDDSSENDEEELGEPGDCSFEEGKNEENIVDGVETGDGSSDEDELMNENEIDNDGESSGEEHEDYEDVEMDEDDQESLDEDEATGCVRVIDNADFGDLEGAFLPSFNMKKLGKLYAVILTPTRELAVQIKNHINQIAKYTDIKTALIVGGMAPQKQIRVLSQCPEIVVATPGRLWDLIQEGNPHLNQVTEVKYLAIDETDRMVEKGHFEELQKLLELINGDPEKKNSRQTFVFSATLSLVHEPPKNSRKKVKKALTSEDKLKALTSIIGVKQDRVKVVDITRKLGTAETLTESRIHCKMDEKDYFLYYILVQHPGRTIIFCNSIDCVRRLVNLFQYLLVEALGLHAQMHQKQRLKNLERFSANEKGILIATDVAARGLDIPHVQHVIHYQVPRTSESYIHRSGRTARASREGISVMFIDPKEAQTYRKICNTLNRDEDLPMFPISDELMPAVKERVNIARQYDKLSLTLKKEELSKSWMKKAAEEADLEYVDSDETDEDETMMSHSKKRSDTRRQLTAIKQRLHQLLLQPITKPSFSGKYPTKSGKLVMPTKLKETALSKLKDDSANVKKILKRKKQTNTILKKKKKKKKSEDESN